MEIHEDHIGFQHGRRDSPLQSIYYACQYLKQKYKTILQVSTFAFFTLLRDMHGTRYLCYT